jgi:hypothetical protein
MEALRLMHWTDTCDDQKMSRISADGALPR